MVAPDDLAPLLPALAGMEADLFGDEAWDAAALRDLVATPGRRLTVLDDDGPVAYALTGVVGDFAELLRIGVAPAARRRGLARVLLADAVAACAAAGVDRMLLEVSDANAGARALYAQAGLVEIDRRAGYYRDGSAALVLQVLVPPRGRKDA